MMNRIWGGMLIFSLLSGMLAGDPAAVADAMLAGAGEAVRLCVNLCGAYMLWMGLMNVAAEAGLMESLSALLEPLFRRIFPRSQAAVGPITLNLAANFLGMGSAATPFGLEAMRIMQESNPRPEAATDDMCLFLCLNASAVELLPTAVMSLRAAAGSADPYAIVLPTFLCSLLCAAATVGACLLLRR